MLKVRIARRMLAVVVGVCAWVGLGWERSSVGQFSPTLPFNPYTSQYQAFSYPTVVNPSLPNQARMHSLYGGRNIFQQPLTPQPFMSPFTPDTGAFPRGVRGVPYHAAFRLDDRFGTTYSQADIDFANHTFLRDQLFFRLSQERDPQKRDDLLKQFAEVNKKLRAGSTTGRRTPGSAAPADVLVSPEVSSRRTSRGTGLVVPPRRADSRPAAPTTAPTVPPAGSEAGAPGAGAEVELPELDRPAAAAASSESLLETVTAPETLLPRGRGGATRSVLDQPSVLDRVESTLPASDRRRRDFSVPLPRRAGSSLGTRLGTGRSSAVPVETTPGAESARPTGGERSEGLETETPKSF
jgi:hypothetical protein